jgi:hypothetical protein
MSDQNKKKVIKATPIATASKKLKEVGSASRPTNEKNFIESNQIKKVNIEDDDRDKGSDKR